MIEETTLFSNNFLIACGVLLVIGVILVVIGNIASKREMFPPLVIVGALIASLSTFFLMLSVVDRPTFNVTGTVTAADVELSEVNGAIGKTVMLTIEGIKDHEFKIPLHVNGVDEESVVNKEIGLECHEGTTETVLDCSVVNF